MVRWVGSCLLTALLVSNAPLTAQKPTEEDETRQWMNDHRRAAELYRAGDTTAAIRALNAHDMARQKLVARRVIDSMKAPPSSSSSVSIQPWNLAFVQAFAALEMEAAFHLYTTQQPEASGRLREHVAIAESLFAFVATLQKGPSAAARWRLAMGLTAQAENEVAWARFLLEEACRDHPDHPALLLACGTAQEITAMLPADALLSVTRNPTAAAGPMGGRIQTARRARDSYLTAARRVLERLVRLEPANAEARIRLAHVRTRAGDDEKAVPLLKDVVSGATASGTRERYLGRLLLGGIHQRAGQLEAAGALFEEAIVMTPDGQSAYVALAQVRQQQGDAAGAALVIERMLAAEATPGDPWSTYQLGQHWLAAPLLAQLRAEAWR